MADSVSMEVRGLSELTANLRAMPQAMQTRILKGMVATGASVIRKEAIERAPQYTGTVQAGHPPPGTLKRAIYQTRLVAQCTPTLEVWLVSVRKGKNQQNAGPNHGDAGPMQTNRDAYYATWIEYGTVKMAARPFMRPAFEAKKQEASNAMRDYVAGHLPAILKAA